MLLCQVAKERQHVEGLVWMFILPKILGLKIKLRSANDTNVGGNRGMEGLLVLQKGLLWLYLSRRFVFVA